MTDVNEQYSIGLDFGTNSVRSMVVRTSDGAQQGTSVYNYPSGDMGVVTDARNPHVARQHPGDYLAGIEAAVTGALKSAGSGVAAHVVGIGVDTTGSVQKATPKTSLT